MTHFKKKSTKKTPNKFFQNEIKQIVESQVHKLMEQHLKIINSNISNTIFSNQSHDNRSGSIMQEAFNYSSKQLTSLLINSALTKL